MQETLHEDLFTERKSALSLKLIAAVAAILVTVGVFAGYAFLRQRQAERTATLSANQTPAVQPREAPKAMILIDDPLLRNGKTTLGGTVRNTSNEQLDGLAIELELKQRTGGTDKKLVTVDPSSLAPQQDGHYSIQLPAQEYSSARLVALRRNPDSSSVAFTTGQGSKRPLERTESKTVIVDKRPPSKSGEFLNSPDNPARVP